MAEETPMSPISEAVPPKANPLAAPASAHAATLKLKPVVRPPAAGGSATPTQTGLKPGLKLPPRPGLATGLKLPPKAGATVTGLKPGVRLPTQSGLRAGLKLPTKPGIKLPTQSGAKPAAPAPAPAQAEAKPAAAAPAATPAPAPAAPAAVKPGVKLPTQTGLKPGLKLPTQSGLRPGIKLPTRPVIRKPGSTVTAPSPLAGKPTTVVAQPATQTQAAPAPAAAPVAEMTPVEMTPVADLPPVEAPKAAAPEAAPVPPATAAESAPVASSPTLPTIVELDVPKPEQPKPLEALKAVTQNLKSITSPIPQQAILRKTGIIADGEMTEAQKQAAKSKTARISLSDAMGVAPVKNEALPMKTIRIKRPVDIPGATKPTGQAKPLAPSAAPADPIPDTQAETKPATAPASAPTTSFTQRKTLKIARPGGGAVRPSGKFGVKKPTTAAAKPAGDAAAPAAGGDVADIPSMPSAPAAPVPVSAKELVPDVPKGVATVGVIVQFAACVAIAALVWLLYENAKLPVFCSGLGM